MLLNRRHAAIPSQTITASGNSGPLTNLGQSVNPTVIAILDVQGPVAGTTPSMTVTVYSVTDEGRLISLASFAAVTGVLANPLRLVIQNVLEPNIQVGWAVSGSGASFGGVTCDLYMTSPDS